MSGHHVTPVKNYIAIFLALMVGTAATVGVAFIDLGAGNTPIALAIAFIKMSLVILFFMHVKGSSQLHKLAAAAGFLWLLIMFSLTLGDMLTRKWDMNPESWESSTVPMTAPEVAGEK